MTSSFPSSLISFILSEIGIWVFVLAGVIGLMIAMGTVTVQSYRAARLDPAKSIRYE